MSTRSQILFITFAVLIVPVSIRAQSPLLTSPSSLGQFPTVEQVKAGTKGTDDVDSHARFMAALWLLNSIIINDLVTAPNGGRYDVPPAAEAVHTRYRNAITRLSIDQPPPAARDPRYRKLEDKYEKDPAFLDALLTQFFAPKFRTDYYAWVRKPVPQSSTRRAEEPNKSGRFNPAAQCPKVEVSSPSEVNEEMPITFTASVIGGDRDTTPTYNWTVSAGTISSGQGTPTITVDTTGVGGMSSTATVNVGGYERRCVTTQSSTTGIRPKPHPPLKFDEYGTLTLNDRNARLDNFAIELLTDPTVRACVIAYGGRKSVPGAATSLMNMSKTYLVNTRGIDASRIVTLDGGYREVPTTELWIVRQDSTPPQATPTVDPSEIKAPIKKKPVPNRRKRT